MTSYIDAISPTFAIIGRLETISGYHDIHMAAVHLIKKVIFSLTFKYWLCVILLFIAHQPYAIHLIINHRHLFHGWRLF